MTSRNDLSVIIPLFNTQNYVESSLKSLLPIKEYVDVICIDDGSEDYSAELVKRFFKRYNFKGRLIINDCNLGLSATRNIGIGAAQTKLISFLDSDDLMNTKALASGCSRMLEMKTNMAIFSGRTFQNNTLNVGYFNDHYIKGIHMQNSESLIEVEKAPWLPLLEPSTNTRIFKSSFLKQSELKFPEGRFFEDYCQYWMSLVNSEKVFVSKDILLYQRVGRPGQITSMSSKIRFDIIYNVNDVIPKLVKLGVGDEFGKSIYTQFLRVGIWCGLKVQNNMKENYWIQMSSTLSNFPEKWRITEDFPYLTEKEMLISDLLQKKRLDDLACISRRSLNYRTLKIAMKNKRRHTRRKITA